MHEFNYNGLENRRLSQEILSCVGQIHEFRGKQHTFLKKEPENFNRLVEIAKIQSTESSNAIEGVVTTNNRLKQLMRGKTVPKSRDEREILGYRAVLNLIHESHGFMKIDSNLILQMHKLLYSCEATSFCGQFKMAQNEIYEIAHDGRVSVRFMPLSPDETPIAIDNLCKAYNSCIANGRVDPLVLVPVFIHDFLCIHPFTDGNGRMSRLLTLLLLYKSGFSVGKYISIEKKINEARGAYYDALQASSVGWHDNKNEDSAFILYILKVLISAYRDLDERIDIMNNSSTSFEAVKSATSLKLGKFTKSDIMELCPNLSHSTIENALSTLTKDGFIKRFGSGNATFYAKS